MTYRGGEACLCGESSPCMCLCVRGGEGVFFEVGLCEGLSG